MILQDKIFNDLKEAKDPSIKGTLKVIIGELQREKTKILSDTQVISVLNKLKKYEEDRISHCENNQPTKYLEILKNYLPKQISREEIETWIFDNIDFKTLKNPSQAIGIVCKHFGKSVDGNLVKSIIEKN